MGQQTVRLRPGGSRMSKYCWGGNRSLQSPAALGFIGVKDVVKTGCTLSKRRVVLRESSLRRLGAQAPCLTFLI